MKRLFDILISLIALILLLPAFIIAAVWIKIDSPGPVFFIQPRVGYRNKDFKLIKFRSMTHQQWAKDQLFTAGENDPRITKSGHFLRRYKIDELPQLINVLIGDMSLVGPRPLVRRQVEIYYEQYLPILEVRPGITSEASLLYRNEDQLLDRAQDPNRLFIEEMLPKKIELNLQYVQNHSFRGDMSLLWRTLKSFCGK